MMSIPVILFMIFGLTIPMNFPDMKMHREHKYIPRVSLLTPKGFTITIEGSNQDKPGCLHHNGGRSGQRCKREINLELNNTDISKGKYGSLDITHINEKDRKSRNTFIMIKDINKKFKDKIVLARGRLHMSRARGKQCFIVLRQQDHTIQCLLRVGAAVSKKMIKFASNISRESVIDILGKVQVTPTEIRSCTEKWVEIFVEEIWIVSEAEILPIQIIDCARSEKEISSDNYTQMLQSDSLNIYVSQDKKLDNRFLDLRTAANQAIFKIESEVSQIFRNFLISKGFIEIHTPKIINTASEGGANVFSVSYFKTSAYLAQSPQFYKQMAIAADFDKVFTVGVVFRAEESHTTRHLTEFVGLDLEMTFKYHYSEVLDMIEQTFIAIFKTLQNRYNDEISTVRQQFHSEPFVFIDPPPRIKFSEGLMMLKEAGADVEDNTDLTFKHEKLLGKLVKEKFNTDFYVLDKYPISTRPFYIMPDSDVPCLSNSYDIFMRGEEVMSGGQRIHDSNELRESAIHHGVDLQKIKAYIDAFRYGCPPHAGGGIGLERTIALFLGLDNIRKTSMFPRDPNRLTP